MHPVRNLARCGPPILLVIAAGYSSVGAAELMPVTQQNALVQKYCAVCHTDAAKSGGLSLQHFDAALAPPSLIGMMLSKLTSGVSLKTAQEADSNADAAALIERKMKAGAMGAAGIPIPDKATIEALIRAFAVESAGAMDWTVERSHDVAEASILREVPSVANAGAAESYRLIASCNTVTREGYLQLAWSPAPHKGTLAASVDGNAATSHRVEGDEYAALVLTRADLAFPAESLTIGDLFPGERVTFSFASLPPEARQQFGVCFPATH
jgi:hypothetical protein